MNWNNINRERFTLHRYPEKDKRYTCEVVKSRINREQCSGRILDADGAEVWRMASYETMTQVIYLCTAKMAELRAAGKAAI